jgi:hypothetical protein
MKLERCVVLIAVLWLAVSGCDSSPPPASSLRVDRHGGYDGEPQTVVLSCSPGFTLASEMGRHSAKIWCELVDGGRAQ